MALDSLKLSSHDARMTVAAGARETWVAQYAIGPIWHRMDSAYG